MTKKLGWMVLAILIFRTGAAKAEDGSPNASICFVIYAPKFLELKEEGKAHVYIDDAAPASLFGAFPRIIATGLDPAKEHHLTVKTPTDLWVSMPIRIHKNVTMIDLWRSAGYWHLEPSPSGKCDSSIFDTGTASLH